MIYIQVSVRNLILKPQVQDKLLLQDIAADKIGDTLLLCNVQIFNEFCF